VRSRRNYNGGRFEFSGALACALQMLRIKLIDHRLKVVRGGRVVRSSHGIRVAGSYEQQPLSAESHSDQHCLK
jgi:hypothetical protein